MTEYFYSYYVQQQYGVSFIITEICFIICAVFLLSRPKFNFRGILTFLAECIGSWVFVIIIAGIIYALTNQSHNVNTYYVYPIFLILFAAFFSPYKIPTRFIVAPMFYTLWFVGTGISAPMGWLISVQFKGVSPDLTLAIQLLLTVLSMFLLYVFTADKFFHISMQYVVIVLAYCAVAITLRTTMLPHIDERMYRLLEQCSVYVLGILIYISFYFIIKEHDQRIQAQLLKEKMERDASLVKITQDNYEAIYTLRHDIKNQYTMMTFLLQENRYDELREYLKKYSYSFNEVFNYTNCGNKVLDNIINIEISKAKEQKVKINCKIAVPPILPYSDADMCSLITNLLDNAIEACAAAKTQNPVVEISISKKQDYLFIRVVNPYAGNRQNGELFNILSSTKRDKENHGYGTKIIRKIAKKYKGTVKYTISSGNFIADLMLSMQAEDVKDFLKAAE